MEFRQDINALRALAVLAVVCYHFGLAGFAGGFVGVDVFFVISGFLMTGIIVTGIEANRFSLVSFYVSRIKRIVPALAVLCAALLAAGWFWKAPYDYAVTARHAASAMGFASNFVLNDEAGYFDSFSKDKWLLHTWSLSVEWQFYMLFPLFVMGIYKFAPRYAAHIFAALAALSLATSVIATPSHASFAFYLLPARMWEMLAGALAFLFARHYAPRYTHLHKPVQAAGLILIAVSIACFDAGTAWPGYAAILPVLGAALIVAMPLPAPKVFAAAPVQLLGTWSYSIYLWHWPIYVALRQAQLDSQMPWIAAGIGLSVLLGFLSYRLVETPLRLRGKNPAVRSLAILFFALVITAALMIDHGKGYPARAPKAVQDIEAVIEATKNRKPVPCEKASPATSYGDHADCGDDNPPAYAVLGDSHAAALFSGIYDMALPNKGALYTKGCPPLMTGYFISKSRKNACPDFTAAAAADIARLPAHVPLLVIYRLSYYLHGYNEHPDEKVALRYTDVPDDEAAADPTGVYTRKMTETLCHLRASGRSVYVLRPIPEIGAEVPRTLARQMMIHGKADDITIPLADYQARHQDVQAALNTAAQTCGIILLDPVPYLCKDGQCMGSENGVPLYADDDHLSDAGTAKLAPIFQRILFPDKD